MKESKVIDEENFENSKVALVYGQMNEPPGARSEVSTLLGRMPSAVGYQPTLATEVGELQERITSTKEGSITSIQAVYVPADDLTDPAPSTVFRHLDATTVLSRELAAKGIYPAVDPLQSNSSMLQPNIVTSSHYNIRGRVADSSGLIIRPKFGNAGSNPAGCTIKLKNFS
eukprot:gene23073-28057_t